MLQNPAAKVFIYGNLPLPFEAVQNLADAYHLQTFQTDNLYQLQQYTREVMPKILIFQITDAAALATFRLTVGNLKNNPLIILILPKIQIKALPEVAHHLYLPLDEHELGEIIESYSIGHRHHDFLLVQNYSEANRTFKNKLLAKNYRVFEVNNISAAQLYLQKNQATAVLIEYAPQFIIGRHNLNHQRIFYVDRHQDLTEIEKFLL